MHNSSQYLTNVSGFIITLNALFDCWIVGTSLHKSLAMEHSDLDEACLHIGI